MESRMEESILNHSMAISRIEDCEDNMNVCKNDVDLLRLEQGSMGRDVWMLEASMGSVHEQLEDLGDRMDGCVAAGWRTASLVEGNACFLAMVHSGQVEARELVEDLNRKFVRINEVIDKKIVRQDEELDKVVGLIGQKIDAKFGEFSSDFMEAMEIKENRRKDLEAKVAFLEEKLTDSFLHMSDLTNLVLSLQGRVTEVEDAVMEESEDDGGEVASSSSSDLDPVENLVAIPVPAPSVIHTLVAIPEEFVPPILRPSLAVPSTPSPEYVKAVEDDPVHDGTPEYWVDPEAGVDH
jgi:chromosome segregation ATPase